MYELNHYQLSKTIEQFHAKFYQTLISLICIKLCTVKRGEFDHFLPIKLKIFPTSIFAHKQIPL